MMPSGHSAQARPLVDALAPSDPPFPVPRPKSLDVAPQPPVAPAVVPPAPPQTVVRPAAPPAAVSVLPSPAAPDCIAGLKALNIVAEATQIGPQADPRCTVVDPVRLGSLRLPDGSEVTFPDRPTTACLTATTFSAFVRELLVPLSRGDYGSPIDTVWTGSSLECRTRDHIVGAKLSAHAQGLAVDIAQVKLKDGRMIEVGRPKTDLDKSFDAAARAGGCGYFHTALGPGSDSFHETHWHFDMIARGTAGTSKFCQ